MEKTLLQIIKNANGPVVIKTDDIFDVVSAVKEATGAILDYTQAFLIYKNQQGWSRKRKLRNTYIVTYNGRFYR